MTRSPPICLPRGNHRFQDFCIPLQTVIYKSIITGLFLLEAAFSTLLDNYALHLRTYLISGSLVFHGLSFIYLNPTDAQVDFFKSLAVSNSIAVSILVHLSLLTFPPKSVIWYIMYFPCVSLAVPTPTLTSLVTQKGTDFLWFVPCWNPSS